VLPAPLAHRLGLVHGTTLVVEQETAEATYVRVQESTPLLIEKGGIFVITAVAEQPLDTFLVTEREQRLDIAWGRDRADIT
jgi:hypothetical protein